MTSRRTSYKAWVIRRETYDVRGLWQSSGMAEDTERRVEINRLELGSYEAVNSRGGRIRFGTPDTDRFSPVELLLAAIGGCTAADVDYITAKRAEPDGFAVTITGDRIRDDGGNRVTNLKVVLDLRFPDTDGGTAAREILPSALARSHDRLCTVSRTVELGTPVEAELR